MRFRPFQRQHGFTLLELLTVLVIIGILAAVALPAMKGIGQSNIIASANRQLLDDIAYARQRAINEHTIVHLVFVPPDFSQIPPNPNSNRDRTVRNRLLTGPFTTYAIFAERTVGDQPGRPFTRYLTDWKTLPEGVFIAKWEYDKLAPSDWFNRNALDRPFKYLALPFPTVEGMVVDVPHIAFDPHGSLYRLDAMGTRDYDDEYISLARGSILSARDPAGNVLEFDAKERPEGNSIDNFNRIHIDGLTGRADVQQPEIVP